MMNILPQRHPVSRTLLILAALATFAASGCGRGTGSITGEVKYNGRPLPIGDIAFLSQEGDQQVRHADIIDGKYSIPSIEVGHAKVVVTTWQPTPRKGSGSALSGAATAPAPVPKAILIPKRYGIPDESDLTYEVKRGSQTKDFDLEP
jgi:hypothetical protein